MGSTNNQAVVPDAGVVPPSKRPPRHLDFLDGIRGLAAFYVMIHHVWIGHSATYTQSGLKGALTNWLLYGRLAVDVFIVLSGFCLVIPSARDLRLRQGVAQFFWKRARRILPPFFAALAICALLLIIDQKLTGYHERTYSHAALLINALLVQDVFADSTFNGVFWSIAVEWKIYFLFPTMLLIWRRFGYAALLGAAAGVGYGFLLITGWVSPGTSLAYRPTWFLVLFVLGAGASGLVFDGVKRDAPLTNFLAAWGVGIFFTALAVSLFKYSPPSFLRGFDGYAAHFPLIDAAAGALTACLLIRVSRQHAAQKPGWLLKFLSWRPLVNLGLFGYSLYLVHAPFLGYLNEVMTYVPVLSRSRALQNLTLLTVGIPGSILMAYLFYRLFERPSTNVSSTRPVPERDASIAARGVRCR